MAVTTGAKAKRFLQPGGANAIFARRRGMVAPPPLKETRQASQPQSRFGQASGQDYTDFFNRKRNINAIRSAIASLKNILVEGFIAAKSLRTTVGNMIKQIQAGRGGGGGGLGGFFSGILGTIGKTALVTAVVVGVAKLFGPKLGEIFGGIKQSLNDTFESIKTNLTNLDNKIEQVYNYVVNLHNGTLKTLINSYNGVLQFLADRTGISFTKVAPLKPMKSYREQFGDKGVNFLSGVTLGGIRDNITSSLISGLTGTADFLTGGLYSNVTGFVGDLLNNFFASLGITDSVNELAKAFGMGSPFGASRQLSNPLEGLGISGTGIGSALTGALGSLGNAFGNPAAAATLPTSTSPVNVPDVSNDPEFIKEVQKLAQETGSKPSELMALYNAESGGLDPRSTNKSGATGIFQLMYGGKFGDVRYGKTREEFKNLSRAEQVKIHRKYLEDAGFFSKGGSGIADVKMANIAPAYLGQGLDEPIYSAPSPEYEGNKNIDLLFGNKDGVVTLREYQNFVNETGGASGFTQYDQNISSLLQPVAPSMKVASKKPSGGVTVINAGGADGQKVASAKPADVSPENTGVGGSPSYKHFSSSSPDKFVIPGLAYGVYEA